MNIPSYRCVRCGETDISIKGYFKYNYALSAYEPDPYYLDRSTLGDAWAARNGSIEVRTLKKKRKDPFNESVYCGGKDPIFNMKYGDLKVNPVS